MEPLRLIEMRVKDFMAIKLVHIKPNGQSVIVGGGNAQGKTALLRAFESGVLGKKDHPDRPIRDGADKAEVEMGIALSPLLHVMLIRDGSLLDDAAMVTLAEIAEAKDMQFFIERVGTKDAGALVIEAGEVVSGE